MNIKKIMNKFIEFKLSNKSIKLKNETNIISLIFKKNVIKKDIEILFFFLFKRKINKISVIKYKNYKVFYIRIKSNEKKIVY
ncbi:hypothetical protein [Candidatus Vidania fulgoroideorum]